MPTHHPALLLDRRVDYVFKRIFGTEIHSIALLDLLNAIFAAFNQPLVSQVTVLNPFLDPDCPDDKTAILDIRAITAEGDMVNVEMQVCNTGSYLERTLYYWAELYSEMLQAGDDYGQLCRTITINILDFSLFGRDRAISLYQLRDSADHELLTDLMQVYFIELPKLGRQPIPAHLQQWLDFLTIDDNSALQRLGNLNPAIGEAYKMLNYLSQDPEERARYLSRKIAMLDMKSALAHAHREGRQEGKQEGRIEGEIQVLQRQLAKRFGTLPSWVDSKLDGASMAQLEIWAEKILTANSLEEIFD